MNIPSNRNPDESGVQLCQRGECRQGLANVCDRAEIDQLTPHCCRHGFATTMLHKGFDPKTVAARGGWKDVSTVMKFYAHAMDDPTVTDALFDTNLTHDTTDETLTNSNKRIKSQ